VGTPKVVKIQKSQSHEDIFLEHYDWLLKSARELYHGAVQEAEDLVQDMYVSFVLSEANVDTHDPDNLRGYLYRILKNLFIRKSIRNRKIASHLTISDYDSVEIALSAVDGNDLLLVRTRLSEICEYARQRRLTHKAASVLILRFFFGYLPSEIAKVLKTNRAAVDRLTHTARLEARTYVTRPALLPFLQPKEQKRIQRSRKAALETPKTNLPDDPSELKAELRRRIFSWNDGLCLTDTDLSGMYEESSERSPNAIELAHLVTCRTCLDTTNELLGIPGLDMHFTSSDEGDSGGPNPPGSSQHNNRTRMKLRRKKQSAFEHRPAQLNVAVNGQLLGTSAVSGELSEFELSLKGVHQPESIEVFSEQGITLLHLDLQEASGGSGLPLHRRRVELSDNRSVTVELVWSGDGLSVNISYNDLPFDEHLSEPLINEGPRFAEEEIRAFSQRTEPEKKPAKWRQLLAWLSGTNWVAPLPIALATGLTLLALGVLTYYADRKRPARPLTPAVFFEESLRNEIAAIPSKGALHRRFSYEVRQENGAVVQKGIVDSLRGKEPARRVVRLYDPTGRLLAGHWVSASGKATDRAFNHTSRSTVKEPVQLASIPWIRLPEADDFSSLVGDVSKLTTKPVPDGYEIGYAHTIQSAEPTLVAASITLNGPSRRPICESFTIANRHHTNEYRFQELSYEYLPASPQLESDFAPPEAEPTTSTSEGAGTPSSLENAHLTLEALMLLTNLGPDVERIVDVERTPDGATTLNGVFETTADKTSVERVFAPLSRTGSLTLDLHAADEPVAARTTQTKVQLQVFDTIPVAEQSIPVDAQLRAALKDQAVSELDLDRRIHQFASDALRRCSRLHREAWNVNQVAAVDFTPEELQRMSPGDRMLWLTLLDKHIRAFTNERGELERQVAAIAPLSNARLPAVVYPPAHSISSIAELRIATHALNQQSERLQHLMTVGFTLSTTTPSTGTTLEVIAQLIATLRDQESKLHDTVERLQSFEQR